MYIGIIGLPASGKTTVFQTLTGADSHGTRAAGKVHTRIIPVPDTRLQTLADLYHPRKVTPATIEVVDPLLAGQQDTRTSVESLLPLMRDADALAHVVRAFDDPAVPHPQGDLNPVRDVSHLNSELLLADLMVVEKRLERLSKDLKKMKNTDLESEYTLLQRCQAALEAEQPLRRLELSDTERKRLRGFGLLTSKAQLVVLNLDETHMDTESAWVTQLTAHLQDTAVEVMPLYGKIEGEIAQLADEEATAFLNELGLQQSGLDRFVQKSYALLGLCSFFTAGEKEVRAWTISHGDSALQAAGVIHSDLARGFIRAEVVQYADLLASGSLSRARELGKLRLEGKEYRVQDGDVLLIRFNV
ncbi:MAG TPA: redox-regulated ATPase YchF [Candidatus Tectomicrobia bacterium]|jgi:GTP-binding protein YchF